MSKFHQDSGKWLRGVLKPLIRFSLRHSHSFKEFQRIARGLFVEVALEEIQKSTSKINPSRISAITGINRRDVAKLIQEREEPQEPRYSVPVRVINRWQESEYFTTKAGKPRVLSYRGESSEFEELVYEVNTDLKYGTILFELERLGLVERTPRGLRLREHYVPVAVDHSQTFELLGREIDTLIDCMEENTLHRQKVPNAHFRTEYNNVFRGDLHKIRKWFQKEAKAFHKRARDFLSSCDKDLSSTRDDEEGGQNVSVTMFSLTPTYLDSDKSVPGRNN